MGSIKDYSTSIKLSSIASGDITAAFKPINTERLPGYCYCLRIFNGTTQPVLISYDKNHNHEYIRAGEKISINSQTNSVLGNKKSFIQGCSVAAIYVQWAKIFGPTGAVYLMGYHLSS